MKKICFSLIAGLAFLTGLTSCTSDKDNETMPILVTLNMTLAPENYTGEGYWKDVYSSPDGFGIYPIWFSHKGEQETYDDITYEWFTGFCPSIVSDPQDYSDGDWTKHQFASLPSPGDFGYVVAHWDVRENAQTPLEERSCIINFGTAVRPLALTIANTTYTYYSMINGTAFSRPFTHDDYLAVDIYSVMDGVSYFNQTVYLAQNGTYVGNWLQVDLTTIGEAQQIYFTMRSSDTGAYGMNVPAYFALGTINAIYPG